MACHAHGDDAITMVLDAWEQLLKEHPGPITGCVSNTSARCVRISSSARRNWASRSASSSTTCTTGVTFWWMTCSAPNYGSVWAAAGSALAAGQRFTFHNDGPVTPANPLRNMQDAVTRLSPSGRVVAPQERIPVTQLCAPIRSTPLGSCSAKITSGPSFPAPTRILLCCRQIPSTSSRPGWPNITVLATILEGRTVYGDLSAIG